MSLVLFAVLLIVASALHRSQTRRELTKPGLWGIAGFFGAGKTYLMTWAGLLSMKVQIRWVPGYRQAVALGMCDPARACEKRPVFANYWVKGATEIGSWEAVLGAPWGSVVLIDEAHEWWPSSVTAGEVDPRLVEWASQLRKLGTTVLFTCQDWSFLSMRLRKLTQGVWEGTPLLGGHTYTLYASSGFEQFRSKQPALSPHAGSSV